MTATSAFAFLFSTTCLVVACGGSAPPGAKTPGRNGDTESSPAKEAPRNVDEAIGEFAAQLAVLDDSMKNDSLPQDAAPKSEPSPSSNVAPQSAEKGPGRGEKPIDVCQVRCRAFASMKAAALALCRMIGDQEARCLSVRRTLDVSAKRVASCGCQ